MYHKDNRVSAIAVTIICAGSALCFAGEPEYQQSQPKSGYYEVSIFDIDPVRLAVGGRVHPEEFDRFQSNSRQKIAHLKEDRRKIQENALKDLHKDMVSTKILPNADLRKRLKDMQGSSVRDEKEIISSVESYKLKKLKLLSGCKLEGNASDRILADGSYGSIAYYYSCPDGDIFLNNHVLRQMRVVFIKELLNTELSDGVRGGLSSYQDNLGNAYSSLRWVSGDVLHVLEMSAIKELARPRLVSLANEIILREGLPK